MRRLTPIHRRNFKELKWLGLPPLPTRGLEVGQFSSETTVALWSRFGNDIHDRHPEGVLVTSLKVAGYLSDYTDIK